MGNIIKFQIENLEKSIDFHEKKIEKLKILLKKVKNKCKHKDENGNTTFISDGYNVDYIISTCSICGETEFI